MNISLKQLLYVKVAADLCSISKASESIRVSPSSISTAINIVEHEYNTQIFVRKPSQGLRITSSGQSFINKIEVLLAAADEFEHHTKGKTVIPQGEISVACFTPMSSQFLPQILKKLKIKLPNVQVSIHESNLRDVQSKLLEGQVDLIFSYDLGLSDRISRVSFRHAPVHVILPRDCALASKENIELHDLIDMPMVLLDLAESRTYFEMLFSGEKLRPKILYRSANYETVRGMVAAGLGFSLLNLKPSADYSYDENCLVHRPLMGNLFAPTILAGWRRGSEPNEIANAFIDICHSYFESEQAEKHFVA